MTMTATAQTTVQRRPIRGGFYGLLLGIGAAIELVLFSVTTFSITTMIMVVAIGVVVGIVWGLVAPSKKAKGAPPNSRAFGSTYTQDVDTGPSPTYEAEFNAPVEAESAPVEVKDDGAFGLGPEGDADTGQA